MNSNIQINNTSSEPFVNPTANPGVRPIGMNAYNTPQQIRPNKMEPPRLNERSDSNYQTNYFQQNRYQMQNNAQQQQYQQHQQNIMQQNHQRQLNLQQQQNFRFPSNDNIVRPQTGPGYNQQPNSATSSDEKNLGAPLEGQRIQIAPQVRFPGSQQLIRPNFNYSNDGAPLNQPNTQNYKRMETPKAASDRIQGNLQNVTHPENYKTHISRDTPANLMRKSSELEMKNPNLTNNMQKPNETEGLPQMTGQPGNVPNSEGNERKPILPNTQTYLLSETVPKSELSVDNIENKKTGLESGGKVESKIKAKFQKENKNGTLKDETISSGVVQKNIKFFEDNDTAKTPLKPETIRIKKNERTTQVFIDVVKSDTKNNEYESGVDETPVVHPNLGSIFQVPRKVAKILKANKRSRKFRTKCTSEEPVKKKQIYRKPLSDILKPGQSYLPYKHSGRKIQKIKNYGSKEELLAFFENTKSWRKLNRYGPKADQNATRDKVVHKPTTNGDIPTPKKTPSKLQTPSKKNPPVSPTKTPLKSPGTPGTPGAKSLPKTPESPAPPTPLIKKVPMNKIQVGAAPSPNLKVVKSKVGSLANTTHKPGGGNVKIETHKIDLSNVQSRTEAKNDMYKPSGGEKKIQQVKLQWSAKSKIGSLENATYKPGGGDKKIESVKLDFKEKAKPKVGSKDNVKHVPGGGNIKIDNQKLEFKAQSKVGSLDNVKHKPGGGDIKIFDDKTYLRQVSGNSSEGRASGTQSFSDLSIVREVEGRSAPGTPGRNTSIKIKKITTIESTGESPKIKNITKVTVTSQTKKEKNLEKSPTKQVKVTYSKISSTKTEESELPLGIVRLPARDHAPVLKPSLGEKDLFHNPDTGKQTNENEDIFGFNKTISGRDEKQGNVKQNSVSPNLVENKSNRDDSGMSKFLKDEIATQEKIGEMWRERNALEIKGSSSNFRQHEGQTRELPHVFLSENYEYGSNRQFRSPNHGAIGDPQIIPNETRRLNFQPNQNIQSDQILQNPTLMQRQINQ